MSKKFALTALSLAFSVASTQSFATDDQEFPIGNGIQVSGLQIQAAYLKPQAMSAKQGDLSKADIHLEVDIHATEDNKNGFEEGAWIPALTVKYKLEKDNKSLEGDLYQMVAKDGPHYGKNIELLGNGKYKLTVYVQAPSDSEFPRHTSVDTGVAPWFKPITASFTFDFKGIK